MGEENFSRENKSAHIWITVIALAFDNWQTTLINWKMVRLDHIEKLVGEDQWSTWKSQVKLALSVNISVVSRSVERTNCCPGSK